MQHWTAAWQEKLVVTYQVAWTVEAPFVLAVWAYLCYLRRVFAGWRTGGKSPRRPSKVGQSRPCWMWQHQWLMYTSASQHDTAAKPQSHVDWQALEERAAFRNHKQRYIAFHRRPCSRSSAVHMNASGGSHRWSDRPFPWLTSTTTRWPESRYTDFLCPLSTAL